MIEFTKKPPLWENKGIEPTPEEITEGYEVGDQVPAPYLNFHLHQTGECIEELQVKLNNENIERKATEESLRDEINSAGSGISADLTAHIADKGNPHGVTAAKLGLDKVDNTPDSEKAVAYAGEAGVGRKVQNNLTVRFNGGTTEGTDLFTFNGSTSRNVNITADKIQSAKKDLSNVENSDLHNKLKEIYSVEATSTDGVAYTATIDGITELYNGLEIVIIPNMTSTNTAVTFNLNGLGTKNLRAKINGYNNGNSGTIAALAGWIGESVPLAIRYISKFDSWQTVDFSRPSASGLYGAIKPHQGGTGISSENGITTGNFLVGNGTATMLEKTPAEVLEMLTGESDISNVVVGGSNWSEWANRLAMHDCSNKDFNTLKTSGYYFGYTGMTNAAFNEIGVLEVIPYSNDWILQRQTRLTDGKMFVRYLSGGTTWSEWSYIYTNKANDAVKSENGTYKGNGNDTKSLTFSFLPKVLLIFKTSDTYGGVGITSGATTCGTYVAQRQDTIDRFEVKWAGTTATLTSALDLNDSGGSYDYIAIG